MEETGGKSLWEVNTDRLLLWNQLFFQISLGMHQCRVLRLTSRLRNLGCVCTAINLSRRLCRGSGVNFILPRTRSPASTARAAQHWEEDLLPGHSADCKDRVLQLLLPCATAATPPWQLFHPTWVSLHSSAGPAATEKQFWSEGPAGTGGELLGKVWLQFYPFCIGEAACGNHKTTTRSGRQPCSREMWVWVYTKMEERKWKLCTHRPWAKQGF